MRRSRRNGRLRIDGKWIRETAIFREKNPDRWDEGVRLSVDRRRRCRRGNSGRRRSWSIWQSAAGTLRLSTGHRQHQVQQHQPNHPTTLQILRFHVCPTLLCLTKIFLSSQCDRNGSWSLSDSRPSLTIACMTGNLAVTSEWKAFHSMAPNGFRLRKSLLFLDPELVTACFQENDKTMISRVKRQLSFTFYELGTRFPAGWFPSIPKQNIFSNGVA